MFKSNFWRRFLEESKRVTNVTLVTREGGHKATHALLLAAGSDFLRSLLQELPDTEEHAVIILPDFSASDLQLCLDAVIGGSTQGLDSLLLEALVVYKSYLKTPDANSNIKEELNEDYGKIKSIQDGEQLDDKKEHKRDDDKKVKSDNGE